MDARRLFLDQYDTVRSIVDDMFLQGMDDERMRHQPAAGLNSMAWYLWHTARWQDFANTLIDESRSQLLNDAWAAMMKVDRRDVGTGMTRDECTAFNVAVDIPALRAYWKAVGEEVRDVARTLPLDQWMMPVDSQRLRRMTTDDTLANERAAWLPGFLDGKPRSWFLSMAIWHTAEHLLGGVVCVRRVSGIPLGI